jgi:hypothetical protein
MTDDRGQMTEGRRQKAEVRGQTVKRKRKVQGAGGRGLGVEDDNWLMVIRSKLMVS